MSTSKPGARVAASERQSTYSLDLFGLERMRDLFLQRIPNFGDFRDHPSEYWRQERGYKEEFAASCRDSLTPDLFPEIMSAAAAEQVVRTTRRLLTRRLQHADGPQNIIGWRYQAFLRQMNAGEREQFARALGELLFGNAAAPTRAERFAAAVWPIWTRGWKGNPFALSRIFPTTFLMALDPVGHIAVRTDLFDSAARSLLGQRLLDDRSLDAAEYERVLNFSYNVFASLQQWAWRPRDMIDVHSFLWVVTSASYGDGDKPWAAGSSPHVNS